MLSPVHNFALHVPSQIMTCLPCSCRRRPKSGSMLGILADPDLHNPLFSSVQPAAGTGKTSKQAVPAPAGRAGAAATDGNGASAPSKPLKHRQGHLPPLLALAPSLPPVHALAAAAPPPPPPLAGTAHNPLLGSLCQDALRPSAKARAVANTHAHPQPTAAGDAHNTHTAFSMGGGAVSSPAPPPVHNTRKAAAALGAAGANGAPASHATRHNHNSAFPSGTAGSFEWDPDGQEDLQFITRRCSAPTAARGAAGPGGVQEFSLQHVAAVRSQGRSAHKEPAAGGLAGGCNAATHASPTAVARRHTLHEHGGPPDAMACTMGRAERSVSSLGHAPAPSLVSVRLAHAQAADKAGMAKQHGRQDTSSTRKVVSLNQLAQGGQ